LIGRSTGGGESAGDSGGGSSQGGSDVGSGGMECVQQENDSKLEVDRSVDYLCGVPQHGDSRLSKTGKCIEDHANCSVSSIYFVLNLID